MIEHLVNLEPRVLFASDVQIQRGEGFVELVGPAAETVNFSVERIDGRTIRVLGDGVTTVGGDVSRRVRIGRDALVFTLGRAAGSSVQVRDVSLAGGVRMTAAGGAGLSVANATIGGLTANLSGEGELIVEVLGTTVAGSVRVEGGQGQSDLRIDNSTISRDLRYENPGAAIANLQMADSRVLGRRTSVLTGDTTDTVAISNSVFTGRFALATAGGADRIHFDRDRFGNISIDDGAGLDAIEVRLSYDFNRGAHGWTPGFADYQGAQLEDPVAEYGDLPANIGGRGWSVGATNRSDDLVSYLTRRIGRRQGLIGDASYVLEFDVALASDARSNAPGIGGAEGESVVLKLGGTPIAPSTGGDLNRLNVDIGDQSNSGPAASISGNIANGRDAGDFPDEENKPYVKMRRRHTHTFPVRAAADGGLNLFMGTESGYEGRTVLLYRRVDVTLRTQR
ncbi:MAG TPA: hypothetical protein VF624_07645 [Tepidisphaeraceae bacterium]|jgi:hypothetical protein